MILIKSYKYKLYNSSSRNKHLINNIECYSEVYNHCIALYKRYYKIYNKSINKYHLQKHLTKIKHRFKTKWNNLGSQAIQDITDRIDRSYKLFFRNQKQHIISSPPGFRSRKKYKSFTLKQAGYKINQNLNEVLIGKTKYKYFNSREFNGKINTLTIKRNNKDELFIIFSVSEEMKPKIEFKTGKMAGFDFGLTAFFTDSEGNKIVSPLYLNNSFKKLQEKSSNLSKKKKGSNNRKKAKKELATLHEKVYNQRNDWQWKLAIKIVKECDAICLEDLSFKEMQQDKNLDADYKKKSRCKKILDLSPASFYEKLKYKAVEYDKKVIVVSRWFPSTKLCSDCNYKNNDLTELDREWTCPVCGTHHDRDHNSAKNLLIEGTSSIGVTPRITNALAW
jgi:putative transposase